MKQLFSNMSQILLIFAFGCGVEIGNPADTGSSTDTKIVADEDVLTLVAEDQYSESISSVTDVYDSRSLNLALTTQQDRFFDREFSCDDSGESTIVSKSTSGEISYTKGTGNRERSIVDQVEKSSTAEWSSTEQSIACNATGRRAKIDWNNMTSLTMSVSHNGQRTQTITKVSDEESSSRTTSTSGTRTVVISRSENIVQEQVTYNTSKSVTYSSTDKSGSYEHSMEAPSETPLVIEKIFSDSNQLSSVTIKSGSTKSTFGDGSIVISSYENLVIDSSTCTPSSGQVIGQTFDSADSETASKNFVISFSETDSSISYDGGDAQTFETEKCRFN